MVAPGLTFKGITDQVCLNRPKSHGTRLLVYRACDSFGGVVYDGLLDRSCCRRWLWAFLRELPRFPLLPVNAPELQEALAHESQ